VYPNTKRCYNKDRIYLSFRFEAGKWNEEDYDELTKPKNK